MQTPDLMPILSYGHHVSPAEGACIMEMASFLAGEKWSDKPQCVNPVLAGVAREVNDLLSDTDRPQILPLLSRLMGTTESQDASLALWCASQMPKERADYYTTHAWKRFSEGEYVESAEYALHARSAHGGDPVAFLTGLLDEYDRLIGRSTVAPLSPEQHRSLVELTTP